MKLQNYCQYFFIFLFIILFGCKNDKITDPQNNAEVVVKISGIDYNQKSFRTLFPDSSSLKNISTAYSSNYSEERRAKLIDNMKNKVSKLGEDVKVIESILSKTGCTVSGAYILPTYAEKAKYEGKDVWMVQFTYGLGNSGFGHYKCFAFSIPNLDTLNYLGCR